MTRRYFASTRIKPRAEWGEDVPMLQHLTVYEADREPVDTGLLDHAGTPLYAVEDGPQIGFVALKERG